eukprot:g5372.t1
MHCVGNKLRFLGEGSGVFLSSPHAAETLLTMSALAIYEDPAFGLVWSHRSRQPSCWLPENTMALHR